MSKEEFMKIQTCVLKVNIHCDGCKHKVKKILQKIEGVYKTNIDAEQGKVTVAGNVDPAVLIKKLTKSGKHAELWGSQKTNNDNGKGGGNNNNNNNKGQGQGQKGGNTNNNNNQPKGGGGQPTPQQLQQLQQQLQLQQMKGLQDLKSPHLKDFKMPPNFPNPNQNQNQKAVKFNLPPEDEDLSDDDYDDYDDDDYDDEFDDEMLDDPHHPLNKMKHMGNVPQGAGGARPNMMMLNGMMNGNLPQLINAQKGGANGGGGGPNGGANGKKGAVPVQINMGGGGGGGGGGDGKNGNGGKKGGGGGGGGGGNQNQGGKNGGKNPQDAKNGGGGGGGGGGGNNKNGGPPGGGANGINMNGNGGKKGNGNEGVHAMPNGYGGPHGNMGQMGGMNIPMGQMGNMPMGHQMGNIPAVQGLPATAMNPAGAGAGYFQGAGPEPMPGNPLNQQYLQALMNQQAMQQRAAMAGGNERFQPMMYARPPPAVNYMPPHPQPHPYPYNSYPQPYPPQADPYTHFFSDENTSSCNVM